MFGSSYRTQGSSSFWYVYLYTKSGKKLTFLTLWYAHDVCVCAYQVVRNNTFSENILYARTGSYHTQYIFNSENYCMIQYFRLNVPNSKFYIAIPEIMCQDS